LGAQADTRQNIICCMGRQTFILLHRLGKKTQKTPRREIEQAKRNLADYRERSMEDE